MHLGFSRFGSAVLLCFSVSLVSPVAYGQGAVQPRRSIEFSETNSAQILTNLNLITNRKEGTKQLEEQLRSLKGLSSPDSIEDRFSLPYSAPAMLPNKRLKELLQRQKNRENWALTPDDINFTTGSYDSDTLPNFTDDKSGSKNSLQQFYEGLLQPRNPNQNSDRSTKDRPGTFKPNQDTFDSSNLDDDTGLPAGIREKTQKLKQFVDDDPSNVFNPTRAHSTFDDFFGLNDSSSAPMPDPSKNLNTPGVSFIDQFKKGMDNGLNPALSSLISGSATRTALSPDLQRLPGLVHKEDTQLTPATVGSVPDPTTLSDLNATVLNQWNPLYSPPKLELPKITPPTPPNMEFPRRRF